MRKETRDRMQSIKRHAGLLGILLKRFAFQITKLALDFLQRGDERTHDNLSLYCSGMLRETSKNAGGDSGLCCPIRAETQGNMRMSMINAMDLGRHRVTSLAAFV